MKSESKTTYKPRKLARSVARANMEKCGVRKATKQIRVKKQSVGSIFALRWRDYVQQ